MFGKPGSIVVYFFLELKNYWNYIYLSLNVLNKNVNANKMRKVLCQITSIKKKQRFFLNEILRFIQRLVEIKKNVI